MMSAGGLWLRVVLPFCLCLISFVCADTQNTTFVQVTYGVREIWQTDSGLKASQGLQSDSNSFKKRGGQDDEWFALQAYEEQRRYHPRNGRWITFSESGDGLITSEFDKAAKFQLKDHFLMTRNQYIHLDFHSGWAVFKLSRRKPNDKMRFWRGDDGWLHSWGMNFGKGSGEGVCCINDEGWIFWQGSKWTPFNCRGVHLQPKPRPGRPPRNPPDNPWHPPRPTTTRHRGPTWTRPPPKTTHTWTQTKTWHHPSKTTHSVPNPSSDPDPDPRPWKGGEYGGHWREARQDDTQDWDDDES